MTLQEAGLGETQDEGAKTSHREEPACSVKKGKKAKSLGWKLHDELHKLARQELGENVVDLKKFALQHVTCPTGTPTDFLHLPFTNGETRLLSSNFQFAVRQYMGLATTASTCNIGECNGVEVAPIGEHLGLHVAGMLTKRHHGVRDAVHRIAQYIPLARDADTVVHKEGFMSDFFELRPNANECDGGIKFDLAVQSQASGHITAIDFVVKTPRYSVAAEWDHGEVLRQAQRDKHGPYSKWNIHPEDMIALAFTNYGAYGPQGFSYLKNACRVAGEGENELSEKYFRRVRQVISKSLIDGHCRMVNELNRRNRCNLFHSLAKRRMYAQRGADI